MPLSVLQPAPVRIATVPSASSDVAEQRRAALHARHWATESSAIDVEA
jgi:hypothetical protein